MASSRTELALENLSPNHPQWWCGIRDHGLNLERDKPPLTPQQLHLIARWDIQSMYQPQEKGWCLDQSNLPHTANRHILPGRLRFALRSGTNRTRSHYPCKSQVVSDPNFHFRQSECSCVQWGTCQVACCWELQFRERFPVQHYCYSETTTCNCQNYPIQPLERY